MRTRVSFWTTSWYAVARVWQFVQSVLIARARFSGANTVGSPWTRTPSSAMATVWQSEQLATATAALAGSTTSLPV